jgi:signal transduction histidine kinase
LRKIHLLLLILIIILNSCNNRDSEKQLKEVTFLDLEFQKLTNQKKIFFLDSLFQNLSNSKNDSLNRLSLFNLSDEYFYLSEKKKSFAVSKELYRLSSEAKDSLSIGKALCYLGDYYVESKKDSAYYLYKQAEKTYRLINNDERIAKTLFKKAHLLFFEGNYIESEIEVSQALKLLSKSTDFELIYACYSLEGSNLEMLEEYDDALKYHIKTKEILKKLKHSQNDKTLQYDYNVVSIIHICNIYDKKGEYNKSILELTKILTPALKRNWPNLYASVLNNLAYSKMKKRDMTDVKLMLEDAISISKTYGTETDLLYKIINLGEYYLIINDSILAKECFNKALLLAEKNKISKEILTSLDFLTKVDQKNALEFKNRYISINDSINKKQRANRNKFAKIEYETSTIIDENKVLTKNNFYILLGSGILGIFLISFSFLRHLKANKRELTLVLMKNEAEKEMFDLLNEQQLKIVKTRENEQNRIAQELHDGVMNKIYGVRLNLGILNSFDDDSSKEKRLSYVEELQNIEIEIRNISHDLQPENSIINNDFGNLVSDLVTSLNNLKKTSFSLQIDEDVNFDRLSNFIRINLYRIIQEALLNVCKYASADNCLVKFENSNPTEIRLIIKDNGQGFEISTSKKGIGLKNMTERVKSFNGDIIINSNAGLGTEIQITFSVFL